MQLCKTHLILSLWSITIKQTQFFGSFLKNALIFRAMADATNFFPIFKFFPGYMLPVFFWWHKMAFNLFYICSVIKEIGRPKWGLKSVLSRSELLCVLNIYCVLNCNTFKLLIIDHIWAHKYRIFSIEPTFKVLCIII